MWQHAYGLEDDAEGPDDFAEPEGVEVECQADERCEDQASSQRVRRQAPRSLPLSSSCVDAHHEEDDVGAAGDVEDLQHEVPPAEPWWNPEEIEVARREREEVKQLSEQRDAFGRFVRVDRPDQDALGQRVRDIA